METSFFKQNFHLFVFGTAVFAAFFILASQSFAQEPPDTAPPSGPYNIYDRSKAIEIVSGSENGGPGGCKTEAACDAYCGSNQSVCMDWALSHGVMSQENYDKYNGFTKIGGPGGCKTSDECKSYCEDESHFDVCLDSGEKLGLISSEQAKQARKTGPGGCKTSQECNEFCENPANQDVCIDSAIAEGFMTAEEAQKVREFKSRAQEFQNKVEEFKKSADEFKVPEIKKIDPGFDEEKAKELIKTQSGPGGCKTFEECAGFCDSPSNQEACFKFAEENGLFKNSAQAGKIKKILKEGGPGGCHGENECKNFCENESNFETCIGFAEKESFLAPEEIEKAKKGIQALKEGGPLGCKTKETCESTCQNPENQEACFDWAKKNGLISEKDAQFIEEAKKFRAEFEQRKSEFQGRRSEGFRGPEEFPRSPNKFPERPGEFPPGQVLQNQQFGPPPGFENQFQRPPKGFNSQQAPQGQFPQNFQIPEGFKPPENFQPPAGFQPPTGDFHPPEGFQIPEGFQQSPEPSPAPIPPQTLLQYSPFGVILKFFLGY